MPHEAVINLARLGYHLVPWTNRNASKPQPLIKNFLYANTHSPETIQEFAEKWPDADWAIIPRETVVLDLENKNGLNGVADLERLCTTKGLCSLSSLLESGCAITSTKSDGRHLWFRAPAQYQGRGGIHLADGIEVKRLSGSAHIPPSMGYKWIRELGRHDVLPVLPPWLIACWEAARVQRATSISTTRIFANGERHEAMCAFAGIARRELGLDQQELRDLLGSIRRTRMENPESFPEAEVFSIADSYACRRIESIPVLAINGDETAKSILGFVQPKPAIVAAEVKTPAPQPIQLDDSDIYATPLITSILEWERERAYKFQPELCLLATLCSLSIIMGRSWQFNGSIPNIYAIGLAETGNGKDSTKRLLQEIVNVSGYGGSVVSDIPSGAGLLTALRATPELLWLGDEFQEKLRLFGRTDAQHYVRDFLSLMLSAYSGATINGKSTKGEITDSIESPMLTVYACAQPGTYWEGFSRTLIENGYMGRNTMFYERKNIAVDIRKFLAKKRAGEVSKPFPEATAELLRNARIYTPIQKSSNYFTRTEMKYENEAAFETCNAIYEHNEKLITTNPGSIESLLHVRDNEKVNRFAMLHAWSTCMQDPRVSVAGLEWAQRIVQYSTNAMIKGYNERSISSASSDNDVEAVYAIILKAGVGGIKQSDLTNRTAKYKHNRDKILNDLVIGEKVFSRKVSGGKKPTTVWYSRDFITAHPEVVNA